MRRTSFQTETGPIKSRGRVGVAYKMGPICRFWEQDVLYGIVELLETAPRRPTHAENARQQQRK